MTFATKIEIESNVFSFFNSLSTSKSFDLFAVILLLRLDSLASKSVLVITFACASLELKPSAAIVLNYGVVTYLELLWSVSFFSSSPIFVTKFVFLTKLLTSCILFSIAVNAVFVAKLLISWILFSNSVSFVSLTKSAHQGFSFPILFYMFDV